MNCAQTCAPTSGELSVRLVAIAPSSDFALPDNSFLRARAHNVGMKLFTRSEVEEQLLKTVPVYGKRGRPSRESVAKVSRKLNKAL
jgi:hypothetical protein